MKDILQEVFQLGFKDKPRYDILKQMFQQKIDDIKLRLEVQDQNETQPYNGNTTLRREERIRLITDKCISDEFLLSLVTMNSNDMNGTIDAQMIPNEYTSTFEFDK